MACFRTAFIFSIFTTVNRFAASQPLQEAAVLLHDVESDLSPADAMFVRDFFENANVVFGAPNAIAEHFVQIRKLLGPIIDAAPKNKQGMLDDGEARYALYRVFMEQRGWVLKNFDVTGEASTKSMFGFDLPRNLKGLLDERKEKRGVGIIELSLFASVLEYLIEDEVLEGLGRLFQLKALPVHGQITRWQAEDLIDMYMASYIAGMDILKSRVSYKEVQRAVNSMPKAYHNWRGTQQFFRSMLSSHAPAGNGMLEFADIGHVLQTIVNEFVYWNNHQCSEYKERLMAMDDRNLGSVRLTDFYRSGIRNNGTTTFVESVEYLRQLGALDEKNTRDPRIRIANYIEGPNNCVARTSFYSVCCMDECADLFSHLENAFRKPSARPDEIIPVVESLSSASMVQCRTLSTELQEQLHEIKDESGMVTLHSKAFQEWMHLAYPHECASTKNFGPAHWVTIEEWSRKTKLKPQATFAEMQGNVSLAEGYRMSMSFLGVEKPGNDQLRVVRTQSAWSGYSWTCLFFVMSLALLTWKLTTEVFPEIYGGKQRVADDREAAMSFARII